VTNSRRHELLDEFDAFVRSPLAQLESGVERGAVVAERTVG
jgi:hypothetical protein